MSGIKKRIQLAGIFVQHFQNGHKLGVHDIAFVTVNGDYIEYEITLRQDRLLTPLLVKKLTKLMSDYQITPNTDICLMEDVSKTDPIRMYLRIVCQQMRTNVKTITLKQMIGRICSYSHNLVSKRVIESVQIANYVNRIWIKLVERKRCKWINAEYGEYLNTRNWHKFRLRKQLLRIGAFYILLKIRVSKRMKNPAEI